MARGPKKHLKRLHAPKIWMLDKLSGIFAPRPRAGPHKMRECLPLALILRNRLKYALTGREISFICHQRKVLVDGKPRTDPKYPAGLMDVVSIPEAKNTFRILYDTKGRLVLSPIKVPGEENRKLLKVKNICYAPGRVPIVGTHDGRTLRFQDPLLKKNDTLVYDLEEKTVLNWIRFKVGAMAMVTGGANTGRVGKITKIERHPGAFDIVHCVDAANHPFATRIGNVFVIGRDTPLIALPGKQQGVKLSLAEDRRVRIENYRKGKAAARR